jgi:predicted nucleic acid-binding protein
MRFVLDTNVLVAAMRSPSGASAALVRAALEGQFLLRVLVPVRIDFQWRPAVPDADDDMVIEAAINGQADAIVTFEISTFSGPAARFGIRVLTPAQAWGKIAP